MPSSGLRRFSFSRAMIAIDVGPTHAAAPGNHGHPANSLSLGRRLPNSHSRSLNLKLVSNPVVPISQVIAPRCAAAPSASGGSSAAKPVVQLLSSTSSRGRQPPSGRCVFRSHSIPRCAASRSRAASSDMTA
jgi:hypothetical protein